MYGSAKKPWRERAKQNKTKQNKQTNNSKRNEQICQIQAQPIAAVRKQNVS